MKKEIIKLLRKIEKENNVTVIFAVESGSRLWGISSPDSDYDVRFVYKKKVKDYLTIRVTPDNISKTEGNIDCVGFDLIKFTKLLKDSNPSCIEWLISDIVYLGKQPEYFVEYAKTNFNRFKLYYHYKSMCRANYEKYIKSNNMVTYKKYLYCLRRALNSIWVSNDKRIPIINFSYLVLYLDRNVPIEVIDKINELIEQKKQGNDRTGIERIEVVDAFLEQFLASDNLERFINSENNISIDRLDKEMLKLISFW